ncbi:MAG: creatininase family protein [Alphaproteobacteria bacterium]|nr:creatininase family protein [Alphaproteobacteria bacterium]
MNEVEWWRLKAGELNALAARNAVVILPVGSTEQHGPHLPTQVDALLAGEVAHRAARRAAQRTPVVVAPTVWSGLAEHHLSLGGTLSLDLATFHALLRCLVRSILKDGFRRVLLLNGHGGNIAALTAIVNDFAIEFDAPIATTSYWLLAADAFGKILERQANVRHACEAETSMLLALAPDLVDMARAQGAVGPTGRELKDAVGTEAAVRYRSFKSRTSHGAIGDPRAATAEKGERLLDAAAEAVAKLVATEEFWTLPA